MPSNETRIKKLERQVRKTQITGFQRPTWLTSTTRLVSGNWNGDSYGTTAKTLIDLSAVFGAPANIKSVLMQVRIRDSGSAANDRWILLAPDNVAGEGVSTRCSGLANDALSDHQVIVPCDANGDIYYQINASGVGAMDVWLQIWGYFL